MLLLLGGPSLALLYSLDSIGDPAITVKSIGNQWYWSYEYSDQQPHSISYDSYLLADSDLDPGALRLLELDNQLVVPLYTHIRLLITSHDVLHSFAVPSLGIKLDAIPGRLNQTAIITTRIGSYYGQCSEICGVNHAFMPICLQSTSLERYMT